MEKMVIISSKHKWNKLYDIFVYFKKTETVVYNAYLYKDYKRQSVI